MHNTSQKKTDPKWSILYPVTNMVLKDAQKRKT